MTPYFSFENELWAKRDGAALTMCRFERLREEPVLRHGVPGAPDEHRIDMTNVVHDGDRFVMWYQGMRPPPQKAQDPHIWHMEDHQNICVAYSDDGVSWEKPNLRLSGTNWGESPDNVLPVVSRDVYGAGVTHDGERYVMMHVHPRGLKEAKPQTTFSIFTSEDGLQWQGDRTPCIDAEPF